MSREAAIIDLIRSHNLQNEVGANVVSILNAASIERTDTSLYNTASLIARLGTDDVAAALLAIETAISEQSPLPAPMKSLLRNCLATINSSGISFASPNTRAIVDNLVGVGLLPSAVAERLKSIGLTHTSPAYASLGSELGLDETIVALTYISSELRRADLLREATARWNTVLSKISSGECSSIEAAIAAFGA